MKLILIAALLGFGMSATGRAAEAFRVYAASSTTQTLWIVDAVPKEGGGLELKMAEKRDLGFPGRVIAAYPEKPLLFLNLEFIKLWHSKLITDASAEHLTKLKHLKGMGISCSKATAALVKHLGQTPPKTTLEFK